MSDLALIADLLAAGVDQALVQRVIVALEARPTVKVEQRYDAMRAAQKAKRERVQPEAERTRATFAALFPDGDPGPGRLTSGEIVKRVLDQMEKAGDRAVHPDTVLRAIGRKAR